MRLLHIVSNVAVFGLWTASTQAQLAIPSCEISPEGAHHTGEQTATTSHASQQLPGFEALEEEVLTSLSLSPQADSLLSLTRPFVHQRRTVPVSERDAEIWVTLPSELQTSVSVNFVEYPPEGDFRVFKTKLPTQEPRRFYLSAKTWDVKANRWLSLVPKNALSQDDTPRSWYVELSPMERVNVEFLVPERIPPEKTPPPPAAPSPVVDKRVLRKVRGVASQLQRQDEKLDQLTNNLGEHKNSLEQIRQKLTRMEQASAPNELSEKVTSQFQFEPTTAKVSGKYVIESGQKKIVWTVSPETITIMVPQLPIQALPTRPFKADITMSVRTPGKDAYATLPSIPVTFREADGQLVGQIPFNTQLAAPLADALLTQDPVSPSHQVTARMRYEIALGELKEVTVEGSLGNWFPIEITQ
jgi:hypothetical protein